MSKFKYELPDVHYGVVEENRDYAKEMRDHPVHGIEDWDDDDEAHEDDPTDPSIIRMLGFDPAEVDDWPE